MDMSGKGLLKRMTKVYPAIVHEEDDGFWMEFPDLPGCYADGDTVEELLVNAEEALGAFLAAKIEAGESLPKPSDISCIDEKVKTYVSVDVNKYHRDTRAVRKMLSIPAWLAKEAERRHYSLSKILQEALMERLSAS